MKDFRFLVVLFVAWGTGIFIACQGSDILGSFFGVFVGVFTCFTFIVGLSQLLYLLPKKLGFTSEGEGK